MKRPACHLLPHSVVSPSTKLCSSRLPSSLIICILPPLVFPFDQGSDDMRRKEASSCGILGSDREGDKRWRDPRVHGGGRYQKETGTGESLGWKEASIGGASRRGADESWAVGI